MTDPVHFYNHYAGEFAALAADEARNWYEHAVNWPSIDRLANGIGGLVLDYGCADAVFTEKLRGPDREICCADAAPRLLGLARARMSDAEIFQWDGQDPHPFGERRFNLTVAKLVLHYVADLKRVAANLADITTPGGFVIISVPHPDKTAGRVANPSLDESAYYDQIGDFGLSTTMIRSTRRYLERVFSASGLEVDEVDEPLLPEETVSKRLNIRFKKV